MATTENFINGDGTTTQFSFSFLYIKPEDVRVELQEIDSTKPLIEQIISTTAVTLFTIPSNNPTLIQFNSLSAATNYQAITGAPLANHAVNTGNTIKIRIYRSTSSNQTPATFFSGGAIRSQDLNNNFDSLLYINQEKENQINQVIAGGIADGSITTAKLADGSITTAKLADGAVTGSNYTYPSGVTQTVQQRLKQYVSVKDFGAKGNGVDDDSGAFRAAFAACQGVYVPAGTYIFDGNPISNIKNDAAYGRTFHLYGDGTSNSRIKLAAGRTFMDVSNNVNACHVHDLSFFDGENVFKFTATAVNVSNTKQWNNCVFDGYTRCAISQQHEDSPYWVVKNCTFKADVNSNTSIGVALGDNCNVSTIESNAFIRNRVHLKMGGGGVDVLVAHNDFLQFSAAGADPRVAIYINTDTVKGDGAGLNVFSNKFGNENKRADDKYIVYADQQSGTFNGDKFPELTQDAAGTSEFRQSQFINNKIQGGGGAGATPFIFSTTRFLTDFLINENSLKAAIAISYWVEFLNPSTSLLSYSHRWFFGVFGGDDVQQTGVSPQFSNEILNLEVFSADTGTEIWTQKHSPNPVLGANRVGYYRVSNTDAGSFTVSGGATKTADIVDGTGGTNAARFSIVSGLVYPKAFPSNFPGGANNDGEAGDPLWLHFDLKQSASDPMTLVSVAFRKAGNGSRQWARFIPVPKNWTTFRFPVFIRDSSGEMILEFKKAAGGDSLDIGRYCLYSSKDCTPQGQVTFDSVKSDTMTMTSPDGTVYNVTVANGGTLTVTAA